MFPWLVAAILLAVVLSLYARARDAEALSDRLAAELSVFKAAALKQAMEEETD